MVEQYFDTMSYNMKWLRVAITTYKNLNAGKLSRLKAFYLTRPAVLIWTIHLFPRRINSQFPSELLQEATTYLALSSASFVIQ